MKKLILVLAMILMVGSAFADTYIVYDGKTGSEKTIELRKSVAEYMAKQMKNATGEVADTLREMSKESDIVFVVKEGDGMLIFDLGKGKEQFKEIYDPNNVAEFIRVF